MPTNNVENNSTLISNTNFYQGHFTRPPTSQNLHTSSPLLQMDNKTGRSQQLLNENVNKTADTWVKEFENTSRLNGWNKVTSLPETSDHTMMIYPKKQSYQSRKDLGEKGIAESAIDNDNNIDTYGLSSNESQLKSNVRCMSSDRVIFFQVFELPNTLVHIFHYQEEGWLLTDEFIQGFTKFQSTSYAVSLLCMLHINVQYKNIDITNDPKFINVGSTISMTMRDMVLNNSKIHLIQLKSVIEILNKLEIISKEDTNYALINDSFIQDIWFSLQLINNAYKDLKYRIERTE